MQITSDWEDTYFSSTTNDPERNLVAAVLIRALVDAATASNVREEWNISCQAKRWFRSNDDEDFSFLWCCQILDLDPTQILKVVDRIKDEGVWNVFPTYSASLQPPLKRSPQKA